MAHCSLWIIQERVNNISRSIAETKSLLFQNLNDFRYQIVYNANRIRNIEMDACMRIRTGDSTKTTDREFLWMKIACIAQVEWKRTESCVVFLWSIYTEQQASIPESQQPPPPHTLPSHALLLSLSVSHSLRWFGIAHGFNWLRSLLFLLLLLLLHGHSIFVEYLKQNCWFWMGAL